MPKRALSCSSHEVDDANNDDLEELIESSDEHDPARRLPNQRSENVVDLTLDCATSMVTKGKVPVTSASAVSRKPSKRAKNKQDLYRHFKLTVMQSESGKKNLNTLAQLKAAQCKDTVPSLSRATLLYTRS